MGELNEWYLPCPAPIGVRHKMEFVHNNEPYGALFAFAEGFIRQNLGSCTDDRCGRIDSGVSSHHTDVVGSEDLA